MKRCFLKMNLLPTNKHYIHFAKTAAAQLPSNETVTPKGGKGRSDSNVTQNSHQLPFC